MKKIAIVADSNSGYTKEQAEAAGIYLVPMPFYIDGKEYFEGINLSQEEFYEFLKQDVQVSTSQPSPESMLSLWEEILKEYEQLLYFPMSSGLSGSCQTAMMLADEFDGRVFVVDNKRISVTLKRSIMDALELVKQGKSAEEIKEYLEKTKFDSVIYIKVDTLKYLKKGGRITPAAAALGTLLRIKPILQIRGEKLDSYAKARTTGQAKKIVIDALKKDIEELFGGDVQNLHFDLAYTQNPEEALEMKKLLEEEFPTCGTMLIDPLSLSVSCHIGEGAMGIACTKKLTM